MASTTQTTNYGLPQYQSSDRPAWTDFNTPFQAVDTALKTASDNASSAADAVSALTTSLATLNQTVSDHTTELSTLINAVATAATAQGTSFTAHGLNTATDVQTAIQNAATAAINSYDNTDSGLTGATVQAALDEIAAKFDGEVLYTLTPDGSSTYQTLLNAMNTFVRSNYYDDMVAHPYRYYLRSVSSTGAVYNRPIVQVSASQISFAYTRGNGDATNGAGTFTNTVILETASVYFDDNTLTNVHTSHTNTVATTTFYLVRV